MTRHNKFNQIPNLDNELDLIVGAIQTYAGKAVLSFPPLNQTPELSRFIKKVSEGSYEEYIKIDGAYRLLGGGSGAYIELRTNAGYIQWRDDPAGAWTNLIALSALEGPQGDPGPQGATGPQGDPGEGVPTGGTTGQVLAKASNTNYDTEWVDQSGGSGGGEWTYKFKTSTQEVNNNNTLFTDSDLQISLPSSSGTYIIEGILMGAAYPEPDIKIRLDYSGTRGWWYQKNASQLSGGAVNFSLYTDPTTMVINQTTAGRLSLEFTLIFDATSSGTFAVQWAQNTSHANKIWLWAGSYFRIKKVA